MDQDIARVLIDRHAIARRLDELAQEIMADLKLDLPQGEGERAEITLIPILTGSIIFVADLIRRLPLRMQIRVMSISSYAGQTTTSRGTTIEAALTRIPDSLKGLHVVLIDDILDTGNTLKRAKALLEERGPASVKTCVLLRKTWEKEPVIEADYVAFEVPDEFVVGYGLDYDDVYRNLPDIVVLKPEVFGGDVNASDKGA